MIEGIAGHKLVKVVLDPTVRDLCRKPYPGHPNGCPNYGKKKGCPPAAPLLGELLDCSQPVWAVYVQFDLEAQRSRMWFKHPKWSKRQAECCLYWQGKVLSFLENRVTNFCLMQILGTNEKLTALYRPEAHGVNVTETMAAAGVELQWPPDNWVYKVALIGTPKESKK
jgi:predicted metal-binding protein